MILRALASQDRAPQSALMKEYRGRLVERPALRVHGSDRIKTMHRQKQFMLLGSAWSAHSIPGVNT